ncbi:heavy-metal-associated domain-containing protein [Pengzhenrongella phosphoraccumulans]|uniref:heavy-metal-associated domain-containing protein n=1 Tax=Pengzhenrongella phosphoraccumulans TaxID=3114394 RepID=UPI00388D8935
MTTASYAVTGMTCGYCMAEVMERIRALVGVTGVAVDLVRDGPSPVVVTSGVAVRIANVRAAVGEAGFDLTGEWTSQQAVDSQDVLNSRSFVRGRFMRATRGGVSS